MAQRIRPYGTATPVVGVPLSSCPSPFAAYAERQSGRPQANTVSTRTNTFGNLRKQFDSQATDRPRTPAQGRFQRHTLAHALDSGNQKAAAHTGCGLIK